MEIKNKVIIITGGAGGIGLAIAKEFLNHNPKIIILADISFEDKNYTNEKLINKLRLEFKVPTFFKLEDIRSIIEYHSLGQIWILDNKRDNISHYLDIILKYSVDLLVINLSDKPILGTDNLINNKYQFNNFEISKFSGFNLFVKILLDKILAILFLLLLSPIFVLAMIFIYIEDGFPIFFLEESAGWDARRFNVYKLRIYKKDTMDKNFIGKKNDKKNLKIGRLLRRLHIDEIPQFFNIIKGDMSIVGPRPHTIKDDLIYANVFKHFLKRNKTSPGLTGWAQVNGYRGKNPSSEHMKKRMEHDLWYMNNWSFWLDLYIIFKTFYKIFTKPLK